MSGGAQSLTAPISVSHSPRSLTIGIFALQGLALVVMALASHEGKFDLGSTLFEIDSRRGNERKPAFRNFPLKLANLITMQK